MEPNVKRSPQSRVDLFDTNGQLIGSISSPVATDILGPGREKVFLARRTPRVTQHAQAA